MKVAIILLDYERHDFTQQVKDVNLNNAGHPFSLITVDKKGISAAINEGIAKAIGHDAIVIMANDILLPDGWLAAMVAAAEAIPNTGYCGIHCVEALPPIQEVNGVKVHLARIAFGDVLIPFTAIEKVGYFNEDYDPYGMQDSDYGERLNMAGFVNYYLPGLKSSHIGHDVGNGTPYRKMKDEGLALCHEKWPKWTNHYIESGDYTIFYSEYPTL